MLQFREIYFGPARPTASTGYQPLFYLSTQRCGESTVSVAITPSEHRPAIFDRKPREAYRRLLARHRAGCSVWSSDNLADTERSHERRRLNIAPVIRFRRMSDFGIVLVIGIVLIGFLLLDLNFKL
jgi:hypothetical protein